MSSSSKKQPRQLQEPIPTRKLTVRESILVFKSSRLHGSTFRPWTSNVPEVELAGQTQFEDQTQFSFSELQLQQLAEWVSCSRIVDSLVGKSSCAVGERLQEENHDLAQDLTTDCSVVASLCALTSRTERGFQDLCASVFHPWDHTTEKPGISLSGKYVFRFYFNGTYRAVVIDDRLPVSKNGRRLFVSDRNNPATLWPALLEKAYLKVRGGYDFPGSNSGTDLLVMTGWVPEQIHLQSEDLNRCALWQKLCAAFQYGDLLVTVGTGKLAAEEEAGSGLVAQHDYAVIDVKLDGAQRLFLLKNPWLRGTLVDDCENINHDIDGRMGSLCIGEGSPSTAIPSSDGRTDSGLSWINFDYIFQCFESIYLNWNPGLFRYREDVHFSWDLMASGSPDSCFRTNPQYTVHSDTGGLVWLLLTRHLPSQSNARDALQVDSGLDRSEEGFISMYAFESAYRVSSSKDAMKNTQFVDSPNTLLKLDLNIGSTYVITVAEQSLPRTLHTFTLSCLSLGPVTMLQAREKYAHKRTQRGRWTKSTAGGNSNSPVYYVNPQFSIKLRELCDVSFILETPSKEVAIHVAVLWAGGKRVRKVATRDILGDTGEYTKGFAAVQIEDVAPGTYTAVCSTFERGQIVGYEFHVSSTSACEVEKVPSLDAGQFVYQPHPARFPPDIDQLWLSLRTERVNRISVTARPQPAYSTANQQTAAPIKLSVSYGVGLSSQLLAVSDNGEFAQSDLSGTCVQDVNIQPESYYQDATFVMIERLVTSGQNHDEFFEICIQGEEPLVLGKWISKS